MSGICSRHRENDPACSLCQKTPADIFGAERWEAMKMRAKDAGEHRCLGCGFRFYLTTKACPMCSKAVLP